MQATVLRTFSVPAAGAQPIPVYTAQKIPLRVLARARLAQVFLAFDPNELTQTALPGGATFAIPANTSDVLVLPPGKTLYALGLVVGQISIAVSEPLWTLPAKRV